MTMIALIDADIIAYACAYAAQSAVDWEGDGIHYTTADLSKAQDEVNSMVDSCADAVGADRVVLCLTPNASPSFRVDFWPDYKRPRSDPSKPPQRPVLYVQTRAFIRAEYEVVEREGLEADDVLGILLTGNVRGFKGDKTVCSLDKDLLSVPGRHYNWRKAHLGVTTISEQEANWSFYLQTLVGDRVDNYPGCPGIGPKRAKAALEAAYDRGCDEREMWAAVVEQYKRKKLTPADALVQARCARILRASDYNFETEEVILWTPPM